MKRLPVVIIALASALFLQASSSAQALEKLSVLRVNVEGSPLRAVINERITWDLNGKGVRTSFHVRVFKGDLPHNTKSMKTHADKNGCIPYHTWVLNAEADVELHVDRFTDVGMLTQDDHGNFSDGTLTLVFEAVNGSVLQDIRLHKTQLPAYFKHAKELVVSPNDWARRLSPGIAARIADVMTRQTDAGSSIRSGQPGAGPPQIVELPNVPCYNNIVDLADADKKSSVTEVAEIRPGPCGGRGQFR